MKTLDGYDGYLGIGNGGFTNGVQVIVDDAIYEHLTGKKYLFRVFTYAKRGRRQEKL